MNQQLFLKIQETYTDYLVDILTPVIFEGLQSIYKVAKANALAAKKPNDILRTFQELVQDITDWNREKLVRETERIKMATHTVGYFDDLVFVVCKCNVMLLSYSDNVASPTLSAFFERFDPVDFIHRCYIECGKDAHNCPYLFYDEVEPLEVKRSHLVLASKIKEAIQRAIRKILPYETLVKEFLTNTMNIFPNIRMDVPPMTVKASPEPVQQLIQSEKKKSEREKVQEMLVLDKIVQDSLKQNTLQRNILNLNPKTEAPPVGLTPQPQLRVLERFGVSESIKPPY